MITGGLNYLLTNQLASSSLVTCQFSMQMRWEVIGV